MNIKITPLLLAGSLLTTAFAQISIERNGNEILVQLPEPQITAERSSEGFSDIRVPGLLNSSLAKGPALPQMSFILRGRPKTLKVKVEVLAQETVEEKIPAPGQPTQSREGRFQLSTEVSSTLYAQAAPDFELYYLGDFRGVHLTRVKINVAKYSSQDKSVSVAQQFKVSHNSREFRFNTKKFNQYLIIVPRELRSGLGPFIAWKESQGFIVEVEEVNSKLISRDTIRQIVQEHYRERKTHFAMLIGTEKTMPARRVFTGFRTSTPSDLYYFTFGGKNDYIPDIFHSRIAAQTPEELSRILQKSIYYELGLYSDHVGFQSIVGVASNEGFKPSDDEYISSIGKLFKKNYGVLYNHFNQNKTTSNRVKFNQAINRGTTWVTYMGHGNGSSWPSFHQTYKADDIKRLRNQDVVKPVVIDIACQNGKFGNGNYLGTKLMNAADELGRPLGAVAYYGGTVNISWHPPAIMARGIVTEYFDQGFTFLGEGLLLGHLYLAKNWDRKRDIIDNMEWFHLQGDPSLKVRYYQD